MSSVTPDKVYVLVPHNGLPKPTFYMPSPDVRHHYTLIAEYVPREQADTLDQRATMAEEVAADLKARVDEALAVLSAKGATNWEKVQAAGLILSGEGPRP